MICWRSAREVKRECCALAGVDKGREEGIAGQVPRQGYAAASHPARGSRGSLLRHESWPGGLPRAPRGFKTTTKAMVG